MAKFTPYANQAARLSRCHLYSFQNGVSKGGRQYFSPSASFPEFKQAKANQQLKNSPGRGVEPEVILCFAFAGPPHLSATFLYRGYLIPSPNRLRVRFY